MNLQPLPYQNAIRDFLEEEDGRVWDWFVSNRTREDRADAVRFDLLKNTYRVERATNPELYATMDEVAAALELNVPVTVYQSQNPSHLNAAIAYIPNEAHIIFEGPVTSKLNASELKALLGHELAHFSLWQGWQGEFLIVDQMLSALTHDEQAEAAHIASARLFYLYNEIFCDRGALAVASDPLVVVSMLVKLATGLDEVHAESYIRQADEIFSKGHTKTAGLTHPETFIRARAVNLWHEGDEAAEAKIESMIEGALALDELDLLSQRKVGVLTRRLIDALLTPPWIQTEPVIAHARLFFPDYSPPAKVVDEALAKDLAVDDQPLRDYFCYVMLDFVTADRELEELPLAAALQLTEQAGLKDRFLDVVKKEMRLAKKQLDKIDRNKAGMLEKAAAGNGRT